MVTVFKVTKAGEQPTRLFLARTVWGEFILGRLHELGYIVSEADDQTQFPEPRDAAELARRDALLDAADGQGPGA